MSALREDWTIPQANLLIDAVAPLLDLYAVVEDVMTEDDAMAARNLYKGMGRIRRAWKDVHKELDGAQRDISPEAVLGQG